MNTAQIIDGKSIAQTLLLTIKKKIIELAKKKITPCLAVIIVGDNPISSLYVAKKRQVAESLGIKSFITRFDENITTEQLQKEIYYLNDNDDVHAILVQLPLPSHIAEIEIMNAIDPKKDVDGFNIENIGKLIVGEDAIAPCTPQGCLHLIRSVEPNIRGMHAVVVGRSNIVGRPMSNILLNEDCTVTVMHIHSRNKIEIARNADILVVATGHARLVTEEWVNKNMIVIDVGISRDTIEGKTKLIGDVDFNRVKDKVRAITPVPGGVGPMTVAYLMKNTVKAAALTTNI